MAHLLCRGFTREETEDAMIELNYLGIHNVLAIRGDETNYQKPVGPGHTVNAYAAELVEQLHQLLRSGRYLDEIVNSEPIPLCIGVAGYPEKHLESPNLKADVKRLKQKVEAGADYVVTQMFFDNAPSFALVEACREAGHHGPDHPGSQGADRRAISSRPCPRTSTSTCPTSWWMRSTPSPQHAAEIGMRWARRQCEELLERAASRASTST